VSRLIAPDEGSRLVYLVRTDAIMQAYRSAPVTIYADAGGSQLADILTYPGGQTVPGSVLTTDRFGMLPYFQLPDGADTVYAMVPGGPDWPVYASTDPRIDALVATTDGLMATGTVLLPSGDASGNTDTVAINASLIANARTVLAPGDWHVTDLGIVTDHRWLAGSGTATILNVASGHDGLTVTGPGGVQVSDLKISGGRYGIVVNGAYDTHFHDIELTGQTSGGVKINGDDATEQHWTDIVLRGVGGIGFQLTRTTSIYTGSLYMDRVRIVEPAAGATNGFKFASSAGSPSLNIAFMAQCVADNYAGDAYVATNCGQIFATQCWFAINSSAPSGAAAMRISGGGFQQTYEGCYTYSGRLTDPSVVLSGTMNGVRLVSHQFDGTATTVALGITGATAYGWQVVDPILTAGGAVADVPAKMPIAQPTLPGTTAVHGEESFSRMLCNSAAQLTPGTLSLTFFTATKSELISTIEAQTNDARVGGTYVGYGLYTVADNNTLTLVAKAEQTSGLTLWGSAFQPIGGFDTKLGLTATYQKMAGQRYAIGALQVGGTGVKLIANLQSSGTPGSSLAVPGTTLGLLSATKAGQTTLGTVGSTTHTAASLSGNGFVPYYVLN
jgi:hypothetical protein